MNPSINQSSSDTTLSLAIRLRKQRLITQLFSGLGIDSWVLAGSGISPGSPWLLLSSLHSAFALCLGFACSGLSAQELYNNKYLMCTVRRLGSRDLANNLVTLPYLEA